MFSPIQSTLSKEIEALNLKAEQGDFQAKVTLGYYYKIGRGVLRDLKQAMIWFAKAYLQDEEAMGGMNNLITCLEEGEPMPIEVTELLVPKIQAITKKAINGDRDAQVTLGYYYMKGVCTPKNQAMIWFAKAYLQDEGAMGGMNNLLECVTQGIAMPEEAARLLEPKIGRLGTNAYYDPLVIAVRTVLEKTAPAPSETYTAPSSSSGPSNFLPRFDDWAFEIMEALEKCKTAKDTDFLPEINLSLRRAAASGKIEVIKTILKSLDYYDNDVDVNQQGSGSKRTALHQAVINEKPEAISLLIAAGARLDIQDKYFKTPLDYATESTNDAVKIAIGKGGKDNVYLSPTRFAKK